MEAEQERTIASLMAEQEDLEHQLNNVSDDDLLGGDDGSELEESELSVGDHSSNVCQWIFDCVFRQRKLRAILCRCKMIEMKRISVQLIFHVMKMIPIPMENHEQNIFVFTKNSPHLHEFGMFRVSFFSLHSILSV